MKTIYIKFLTEEDRMKGLYALSTRSRFAAIPDKVYQVLLEALPMLDQLYVGYRRATDAEVKEAHGKIPFPTIAPF